VEDQNMTQTQALTMMEFNQRDFTIAERIAKFLGYKQYPYTTTSALWGLFCLRENPEYASPADLTPMVPGGRPTERQHNACIIKTQEMGFLVVYDLEDFRLDQNGRPE
jgi:hypothetical protein